MSAAKINALVKEYFDSEYTVVSVKLLSKTWELERNGFDRVLRRLHSMMACLKNKKTGKCYFAFRYIGQEFDGSNYGESSIYKSSITYYTIKNDKSQPILVCYMNGEFEVSCADLSK